MMSLLSLVAALLLEQVHPLAARKYFSGWLSSYADFFQHHFNAGENSHGKIALLLAVLLPLCGTVLIYWFLFRLSPIFAWLFNVLALYFTMGFRQFSHYFTDIHQALRNNDLDKARSLLATWRGMRCHELSSEEVARISIEEALLASHRRVFGVVAWFVIGILLGLGPVGAVLYRLSQFLAERWSSMDDADSGKFGLFAGKANHWMEWLPLRMTAITFAIVGNFEDTVYCWRTQAKDWHDPEAGIVLASGAGALGVRLGLPIPQSGHVLDRPELGMGDETDIEFMRSAVGLVWRALVFWMVLLLLLGMASLMGG